MPRVPKIDELHISRQGIDAPEFRPVQGQHVQPVQGMDAQRLRMQRTEDGSGMAPVRFERAIQASDMPSRQLQAMGQAMASWGDLIREIGLRESEEVDRARVQEGINRYMEQSLDAQQNQDYGWQTMQGANALGDKDKGDLATQRAARMKPVREQLLQNLGNERQKEAFARLADEEDARANELIGRHVLRESEKNKREQLGAGVAIAGKMMMGGEEERQAAFAKINEHVAQLAQMDGLSGEALIAKRQELASPYVRAVIAERINAYDREGSAMMLAEYEDYLTAGDKVELMSAYKTMHEVQTAREAAEAEFAGENVPFQASQTGDPWAAYNHGFDAKSYIAKLVDTESSGNNYARPVDKKTGRRLSSAYGRAQFTDGTWIAFGRSEQGAALRGNMSDAQWLDMRTNPDAAVQATLWYAQENRRVMNREKIPFNNLTAYLFHFGGAQGGRELYKAHPDTPLDKVLTKGQLNANRELVARTKTAGGLVAYFAKKMGVEPTGELPTGQPQRPVRMSNAQVKKRAQELYPNNPNQQRAYIDLYATKRDVEAEAQEQQYSQTLSASVSHIWSGGKVSELPPEVLGSLSSEDQIKLIKMEDEVDRVSEKRKDDATWQEYMEIRQAEKLVKMSREAVTALPVTHGFSRERTKELVKRWETLQKDGDGGRKRARLEKAELTAYKIKAFGDLYEELKKNKELEEMVDYRIQEKIAEYSEYAEKEGWTPEKLQIEIESELRQEFIDAGYSRMFWADKSDSLKSVDRIDIRSPFAPYAPQEDMPEPPGSNVYVEDDDSVFDHYYRHE